jgi:hypothetical protein
MENVHVFSSSRSSRSSSSRSSAIILMPTMATFSVSQYQPLHHQQNPPKHLAEPG